MLTLTLTHISTCCQCHATYNYMHIIHCTIYWPVDTFDRCIHHTSQTHKTQTDTYTHTHTHTCVAAWRRQAVEIRSSDQMSLTMRYESDLTLQQQQQQQQQQHWLNSTTTMYNTIEKCEYDLTLQQQQQHWLNSTTTMSHLQHHRAV